MRHSLWVFATPQTTVYAIRSGPGVDDAATVLGTDLAGVLVRDGWAPYRRFTHALHQTCLAHYADLRIMPRSALMSPCCTASATRRSA